MNNQLSQFLFHICKPGNIKSTEVDRKEPLKRLLQNIDFDHLTPDGHLINELSLFMSEQEIKLYSLLGERNQNIPIQTIITSHAENSVAKTVLGVMANLMGSGQLTGGSNGLDGIDPVLNYAIWKQLIDDLITAYDSPGQPEITLILQNLRSGLDQLYRHASLAQQLANQSNTTLTHLYQAAQEQFNKLTTLKPGESLLLHGGWNNRSTNKGGHAHIYQIVRRCEQTVDLLIHISTALEYESHFLVGCKRRQVPLIRYEGIPLDMEQNAQSRLVWFLQGVLELKTIATTNSDKRVDDALLLLLCKPFEEYRKEVFLAEYGAITGQRGGTCASSVTKQWMRWVARGAGVHKQLVFRCHFILLTALYHIAAKEMREETPAAAELRYAFRQQAKKLLSRTAKAASGFSVGAPLISSDFSVCVRATAHDLLCQLERIEDDLQKKRTGRLLPCRLDGVDFSEQQKKRRSYLENSRSEPPSAITAKPPQYPFFDESLNIGSSALTLLDAINLTFDQLQSPIAVEKNEQQIRLKLLQIAHLVDQLPFLHECTESFWQGATLDVKQKLQGKLCDLIHVYAENKLYQADPLPRRFATLLPLHAAILHLTLQIDRELLKDDPDPLARLETYTLPTFLKSVTIEGLQFYSRIEFERISKAVDYFQQYTQNRTLELPLFENEQGYYLSQWELEKAPTHGIYWKALTKARPDIKKLALEKAVTYDDCADMTAEEAQSLGLLEALPFSSADRSAGRHYNLSEATKIFMALEAYHEGCLSLEIWPHVARLRDVLFTLNLLMNYEDKLTKFSRKPVRYDASLDRISLIRPSIEKEWRTLSQKGTNLQRPISNEEHLKWLQRSRLKRNRHEWEREKAEGHTLNETPPIPGLLQRIERTAAQWKIAPLQQLHELDKEVEQLADSSLQGTLLSLFFRSPYSQEEKSQRVSLRIGVGELICSNSTLVDESGRYVRRALAKLRNLTPPAVAQGSFYFELTFHLAHYLAEDRQWESVKQLSLEDEISSWLSSESLTEEHRALLHFYRLAFRLLSNDVDDDRLTDLFGDWLNYRRLPFNTRAHCSPILQEIVLRLLASKISQVAYRADNEDWAASQGSRLLELSTEQTSNGVWRMQEPHSAILTDGKWVIDLMAGTIHSPEGTLSPLSDNTFPWEKGSDFKRLFGENVSFCYRAIGKKKILFSSPFGDFQMDFTQSTYCPDIYRRFADSDEWYRYRCYYAASNFGGIPLALAYDHSLWVPRSGPALITDLKEQKVRYRVKETGLILDVRQHEELQVDAAEGGQLAALEKFEENGFILIRRDTGGKIVSISLPRYLSSDAVPLQFMPLGDGFVWNEHRDYALAQDAPQGLIGNISNYLYLTSRSHPGRAMLLLPIQPADRKRPPLQETVSLNIKNTTPLLPSSHERCATQRYASVEILSNGSLRPLTRESELFLAYLKLTQRQYAEAVGFLNKVLPLSGLSPLCLEILSMIQAYSLGEDHPDGKAVKLHASLQKLKERKRRFMRLSYSNYPDNERIRDACNLSDLLQGQQMISASCRLPADEEKELIEALLLFSHWSFRSNLTKQLKGRLKELKNEPQQSVQLIEGSSSSEEQHRWRSSSCCWAYSEESTDWLNLECPTYQQACEHLQNYPCATLPSNLNVYRNGPLFLAVYRIAKGKSETARRALHYRLSLWLFHTFSNEHLACLLLLTMCPEKFPNFPDKISEWTPAERFKFVRQVELGYNQCYDKPSPLWLEKKTPSPVKTNAEDRLENSTAYPLPLVSAFAPNEPGPLKPSPFKLEFDAQEDRWRQLESWEKRLERDLARPKRDDRGCAFTFDDGLLAPTETLYKENIKRDLEILKADYDVGKRKAVTPGLMMPEQAQELCLQAEKKLTLTTNKKKSLIANVLQRANQRDMPPLKREAQLAGLASGQYLLITLDDCFSCLKSGCRSSFRALNPFLVDGEIDVIANVTLRVGDLLSYEKQLLRIIAKAKAIAACSPEDKDMLRALSAELEKELQGRYYFDGFSDGEQLLLRYFSARTGIIPFKIQMEIIRKILTQHPENPNRLADLVFQLIMGGGKTSVIAVLVLYLLARRSGRFACLLVPPALLKTTSENLNASMLMAFDQPIATEVMTRADFTREKLSHLYGKLDNLVKTPQPVILSAPTLQGVELEMLSLALKIASRILELSEMEDKMKSDPSLLSALKKKESSLQTEMKELIDRCVLCAANRSIFRRSADVLLDEVDLLLDSFQEVSYVDGEQFPIDRTLLALLRVVFQGMVSEEYVLAEVPGQPTLRAFLRLTTNDQANVGTSDYLTHVVPLLAKYVAVHFKPIQRHLGKNMPSFVRYLSGTIPPNLEKWRHSKAHLTDKEAEDHFPGVNVEQLREDLSFLHHLEALYQNPDTRQAANLIAQAKHILLDLHKVCLRKTYGQDYGLSPRPLDGGKVIPFVNVNAPAIPGTEFGYHWEHASYELHRGVFLPPDPSSVKVIADSWLAAANEVIRESGEPLAKTPEYQEFYDIFGVAIDQISKPEVLEQALLHVKSKSSMLLEMQEVLTERLVHYTPKRLTSNGFALVELISSCIGMSAMPWNVDGYPEPLANNYLREIGTEGRVLYELAVKVTDDKILDIEFSPPNKPAMELRQFFEEIYALAPKPMRLRISGLIETGALFNRFGSNAEVARIWAEFLADRQYKERDLLPHEKTVDPKLEAVLFCDVEDNPHEPDTLYAWRFGTGKIKIGSSFPEALAAKGLTVDNYVVYYSERHTTGFDVKQRPDAVNLLTFSPMLLRKLTQGSMRLRGLLLAQELLVVVDRTLRRTLYQEGKTIRDLMLSCAKAQSLHKVESIMRHLPQYIIHLTRKPAVEEVCQLISAQKFDKNFAKRVLELAPFFVTSQNGEPYPQHGHLQATSETKDSLNKKIDHQVEVFKRAYTGADLSLLTDLNKSAAALKNFIKNNPAVPMSWHVPDERIGLQQQVQQHAEVQQNVEVAVEIETELEVALQQYKELDVKEVREEKKMSAQEFERLLFALLSDDPEKEGIISLKSQLAKHPYKLGGKQTPYHEIFAEPLYGTDYFFFPIDACTVIPVFHRMQRPSKQILACQSKLGLIRFLFLSEHEARAASIHLRNYTPNKGCTGCWLLQPDGSLFVKSAEMPPFPSKDSKVKQALLEINAFAGNLDYLNKKEHRPEVTDWLESNAPLKVSFLKLRALSLNDPLQKRALESSLPIAVACGQEFSIAPVNLICKQRLERESLKQGKHIPASPQEAKSLVDPEKLRDLNVAYVKYLHTGDQLGCLSVFHLKYLSPDQLSKLPASKVSDLDDPDQLVNYTLSREGKIERRYLLQREQLCGLTPRQRHLIPAINPDLYCYFDQEWQIATVSASLIGKINPKMGCYLTNTQLKTLDPSCLTKELLDAIASVPGKLEQIPADYLEWLAPHVGNKISRQQIAELSDEKVIPRLEKLAKSFQGPPLVQGLWSSWIAPQMVPFISAEQAPYLTQYEQIALCPIPLLKKLTDKQLRLAGALGEIDSIKAYFNKQPTTPQENLVSWIDLYCAHREKEIWPRSESFFNAVAPEAHRFSKLSKDMKEQFLTLGRQVEERMSSKQHHEKLLELLKNFAELGHKDFRSNGLQISTEPPSNDMSMALLAKPTQVLGDKRFLLSRLVDECGYAQIPNLTNALSLSDTINQFHWIDTPIGEAPSKMLRSFLRGVNVFSCSGPRRSRSPKTIKVIGRQTVDHLVKLRDLTEAIRASVVRLSMRNIVQLMSSPIPSWGWPFSQVGGALEMDIACRVNGIWKGVVRQTYSQEAGFSYSPGLREDGSDFYRLQLLAGRCRTHFKQDGSITMEFKINNNSFLKEDDITLIPPATKDNSNTDTIKDLFRTYKQILIDKYIHKQPSPYAEAFYESVKNSEVIASGNTNVHLLPLLLPSRLVQQCDALLMGMYTEELFGPSLEVERRYHFSKSKVQSGSKQENCADGRQVEKLPVLDNVWELRLEYLTKGLSIARVVLATIDEWTLDSYREMNWHQDGLRPGTDYYQEEFLLQALYGSSLPGPNTKPIKGVVAPQEITSRKMLYAWWEENPDQQWHFDSRTFTGEYCSGGKLSIHQEKSWNELHDGWKKKRDSLLKLEAAYRSSYEAFLKNTLIRTTIKTQTANELIAQHLKIPQPQTWKFLVKEAMPEHKSDSLADFDKELGKANSLLMHRLIVLNNNGQVPACSIPLSDTSGPDMPSPPNAPASPIDTAPFLSPHDTQGNSAFNFDTLLMGISSIRAEIHEEKENLKILSEKIKSERKDANQGNIAFNLNTLPMLISSTKARIQIKKEQLKTLSEKMNSVIKEFDDESE